MRIAAAIGLALAGCSEAPPAADPATDVSPPAAPVPTRTAQGGGMTAQVSDLNADISGLNVRTTDTRVIVDLPSDTLFDFDRADISRDAQANLAKVADLIRQAPAGTIEVSGYTDAKGDDAYNLQLSEQRAQAVVNWMREQVGVRQRQFQPIGKGEADPVATNERPDGSDDRQGRARNRRVTVSIPR